MSLAFSIISFSV